MCEEIEAQMTTRRTAFWILGMAAFGMGMPAAVLTASDAEAQTPGTERRQERRTGTTGTGSPGTGTTGQAPRQ